MTKKPVAIEEAPAVETDGPAPVRVDEVRRIKRESRHLDVPLTIHEKVDMGASLVTLFAEKRAVEEELNQTKLEAKESLGRIDSKIESTVDTLRAGSVQRPIDVEIVMDFEKRIVTYTRRDTGEEYQSRPMSYDEVQTSLHLA